jgi:hypothetical protein
LAAVVEGEMEMSSGVRRSVLGLALVFAPALIVGCASAPPPVPQYVPKFTYSYPPGEAPASDVTIAIVKPVDANVTPGPFPGQPPAGAASYKLKVENDFRAGIVAQLQELLNRKGFKQTGPFDDLNSMTFPDKKGSDLTLTTQLGLSFTVPPGLVKVEQGFGDKLNGSGVTVIETKGACSGSGFISFVMLEPLSGEKIWIKKVDFPNTEVDCTGKGTPGDSTVIDNGLARLLEKAFQLSMKKTWDYLSPEEVTLLKKQSQELRAKKVY